MDQRKFHGYLLDPTHPDGKHKLRLWIAVFGIGEGDGPLLERLIREQIGRGLVTEKPPRTDLRRFEVVIHDFTGPYEKTGPVLTAWVAPHGAATDTKPRFITAFPVVP